MASKRRFTRIGALVLTGLLAAGLGACGDDDDEEGATTTTAPAAAQQGAPVVDVTMAEYSYTVSGPLTAGGTLRVKNAGEEFHMIAMGKMKPGVTLDQITTALSEGPPGGGDEGGEGGEEGGEAGGSGDTGTSTTTGSSTGTGASGGERRQTATTTTTSGRGTSTTSTLPGGEEEEEEEGGDEGSEGEDPFDAFFEGETGIPGNFMGPGQAVDVTVPELGAGTYAMLCFVPVEGGGPPHFAQGMVGELAVVEGSVPPPTPTATYTATEGEAIEGPTTLKAGKHVVKVDVTGEGAEQLEPGLAKPDAGKTVADMNRVFESFEGETEEDFTLPEDAADQVPGAFVIGLFDMGQSKSVYLGVDLTPGTYQLVANDTDAEDVPLLPRELATIRVE